MSDTLLIDDELFTKTIEAVRKLLPAEINFLVVLFPSDANDDRYSVGGDGGGDSGARVKVAAFLRTIAGMLEGGEQTKGPLH